MIGSAVAVAWAFWFLLNVSETHSLQFPSRNSLLSVRRHPTYQRHPHLQWRSEPSTFSDPPAYIDFGPAQYQEEEQDEEEPSGTVLEYDDMSGYEQPLSQRRLYDVLLKEAAGYEDSPEEDTWYDEVQSINRYPFDGLLGELASPVRYVDDNGYEMAEDEEEEVPEYSNSYQDQEDSDPAVQQLKELAKKSQPPTPTAAPGSAQGLTPSPQPSPASSTHAPDRYVQQGQKEVALLRPPTQTRPGLFGGPLEDQLMALRRTRGGSYEVLRELIAKEKRQEKERESAASKAQHQHQKRYVTSEDNLTEELHTLKKKQA